MLIIAAAALAAAIILWLGPTALLAHVRAFLALTPSTKRALRTLVHLAIALGTATPVLLTLLHGTPAEAQVAAFAAWVALVTKVMNALEDAGAIPAWLK